MSIINLTNTAKNHTVVTLKPRQSELRNVTFKDRPLISGTILKVGHDRFGFPRIEEGYSRDQVIDMLARHYAEGNLQFIDGSILIRYTQEGAPIWTGHKTVIMKQPYELIVPAPIVWELELSFGYPLQTYLEGATHQVLVEA